MKRISRLSKKLKASDEMKNIKRVFFILYSLFALQLLDSDSNDEIQSNIEVSE